jgi:hypothetical protein
MLARSGAGLGLLGLTGLFADAARAESSVGPLAVKKPHFTPKAKRVIHIFCNGGPSQVDTFDPKPILAKFDGKTLPMTNLRTERKTGAALPSPFKFKKRGKSGLEISELFDPSLLLMNCGEARLVRPSFGSWLMYGLGTENQNLPGFVALCPGGYPIQESQNWQSAFLPGIYQGTYVDTKHTDIEKLIEHVRSGHLKSADQKKQLDLLQTMNRIHSQSRPRDPQLEARIQSFEIAARMQTEATDAFDTTREPKHIQAAYGSGPVARSLLTARRLVERGVRFVQVWHGQGQPWDSHDDLEINHRKLAKESDQGIAALIDDLKRLGLFEDTLILWGGEFGRTPVVELPQPGSNAGKINGRDHNHWGFTCWLAGGGVKGGTIVGATDEFGFKAVENRVHVHDLHATMLHLLGFDHEKFTYRYAGRDFRLTDVHGHVVKEVLA